jgi:hypothetical protein
MTDPDLRNPKVTTRQIEVSQPTEERPTPPHIPDELEKCPKPKTSAPVTSVNPRDNGGTSNGVTQISKLQRLLQIIGRITGPFLILPGNECILVHNLCGPDNTT